jgi:hypothetical protein
VDFSVGLTGYKFIGLWRLAAMSSERRNRGQAAWRCQKLLGINMLSLVNAVYVRPVAVQLFGQPRGGAAVLLHLGFNQLAYVNLFFHGHARFGSKKAWTISLSAF